MKKLLLILLVALAGFSSFGQTYNPTQHTTSNKAYGPGQAVPTDARSMYYDATLFVFRPYQSTAEVLSYLNLTKYREGKFDIIVNSGGVLSGGVITGGINYVYYFRNGLTNADLVRKSDVISVNGQVGIAVVKNADSLLGMRLDTSTVMRNNYAIAFDSTNRKWALAVMGSGGSLSAGTGIDITSNVVSALNTSALWNANQLRGRAITTATPATNQTLKWNGTQFDFANIGVDSGVINSTEDTLRLYVGGNIVKIFNIASKLYVDSVVANIPLNPTVTTDNTLTGVGSVGDPLKVDTLNYIATISQINAVNTRIDNLVVSGTGITAVIHDITLTGAGTSVDTLKVDTSVMATKSYVDNLPGITPPDGSETIVTVSGTGLGKTGTGTVADPYILTFTGAGTTNPFNALDIRNFLSAVANAVTPASGANATGFNCTPSLNAMLLAAGSSGQLCIVPDGEWLFSTAPDTISTKRLNLVIYGNTHHNQQNFIIIKNASGSFRQHRFIHWGIAWGRENLPTHSSSAAVGGRVSPTWSAYTGTFITVYNTDQVKCWFNKAAGFAKGIEVLGGGGNGAQENEFYGGWIQECAIGISLRSLDGSSFVDKNKFFIARVGGGLPIKIDGFSGTASNGETWNGAFRSDEFHVLLEFCDSAVVANGDITEPLFNITVEGGTNTGILGNDPFRCKLNNSDLGVNSSNNYVRGPKWTGQGVYGSQRVGDAVTGKGTMGVNGTIKVPIWNGGSYYGNEAIIDNSGQVNIFCMNNVSQSTRSAAPAYIKFVNYLAPDVSQTITASTYTPAANDRFIFYNASGATLTLPTAATYPTREITVVNIHATAALTIGNVASGFQTSLTAKKAITYRSDGVSWYTSSESMPLPIALNLINATAAASDYVMTTDGTVAGASWAENFGGYQRFSATTTAASGSVLAAVTLPASKGMELDVIIIGYRTADQTVYRQHLVKGYATTASASAVKGTTTVSAYTSDFAPTVFTEQASGTLTYTITVSSVATETIQWSAYVKIRPTFTSL